MQTITKFIEHLEELKKEHGDIWVNVFDPDTLEDGELETVEAYAALSTDAQGKVNAVTICDKETVLAFL